MIERGRCIVMDVDGTLCPIKESADSYADLQPYPQMVSRLQELRDQGFYVILQTSRNMYSYEGNVGLINARMLPELVTWLDHHDVPYDEIHVAKPWAGASGFYVDDRAIRPAEFLRLRPKEIAQLIERDREGLG